MTTYLYRGCNDEADTCSCCGRTGLKRVVWLEEADGGEAAPYGTTCAALLLTGRKLNRSEAEKAVDAAFADACHKIVARWRAADASAWAVERHANAYGVDCFYIAGEEIVASAGLRHEADALAYAVREYRARMAKREIRESTGRHVALTGFAFAA